MRKRLMSKSDLTLEAAIDLCKIDELTTQRLESIQTEEKAVNKIRDQKKHRCLFCGDEHEFKKALCPAYEKNCTICNGRNHFAKVCKKKKDTKKEGRKDMRKKKKKVKEVNEQETDSDYEESSDDEKFYKIEKVTDNSSKGGNVIADLEFKTDHKNMILKCELDTGANVCMIGYQNLCELLEDENPILEKTSHKLYGFEGSPIKVRGEIYLRCKRLNKIYDVKFVVAEVKHRPLLSAEASRVLKFMKYCNSIQKYSQQGLEDSKKEAEKIIKKYKSVFEGHGLFPGEVNMEINKDVKPVVQTPRRIPIAFRKRLKEELEQLVEDDIITKEESRTEWVSNILLVKKNTSFRICLAPIPLNVALKRSNFQFTTIDEILRELGKAKVFTTEDIKKGFWQIKLNEESSKLTTFWTPFGRFRWKRLPFGVAPALEIFQIKMQDLLTGLEGVEVLADDIIIYGCSDTETKAIMDHNTKLTKLLQRLKENNCKLNLQKLKLCQKEVKFYGHNLTCDGLKVDQTKVEAIKQYPQPKDKKALLRFNGMITYLSRYIPNLSTEIRALRKLTHDDTAWDWTSTEEKEFLKIKHILSDAKTLKYYDVKQPVTMECDSSSYGLGVAIYQQDGVIGYASRTLTKSEQNFAQIEKELLSIVFECVRFDQLLVGNEVIVKTDHKPLLNIFKKPLHTTPKRLQKMLMVLQRYNIQLQFIVGKENVVADALSRAPTVEEQHSKQKTRDLNIFKIFGQMKSVQYLEITSERVKNIREETARDNTLQKLMTYNYMIDRRI